MQDFKSEYGRVETVKVNLQEIHDVLAQTYQNASQLYEMMVDPANWEGEAQKTGVAFLDLTMQYHGLLAEQGEDPVGQACEDMEKYLRTEAEFYENWDKYQELLKI